jgi:hypothetical protein
MVRKLKMKKILKFRSVRSMQRQKHLAPRSIQPELILPPLSGQEVVAARAVFLLNEKENLMMI